MKKLNLGKAIQFMNKVKEYQLPFLGSTIRKGMSLLRGKSGKKKTDDSFMQNKEQTPLPQSQTKLRLNLKALLVLPIISVIIASSLFIAYVSYEKNREVTISAIENQMQLSSEVMKEKISMLKATVTNQEFPKKLAYELELTQTHFNKSNLKPMQFKITQVKKPVLFEGVDSALPNLPAPIIDQMFQQKDGIIHYQGLTFAFSFQLEMDGSLYVIALRDDDYLQAVTDYRNFMMEITLITILLASLVGFLTIRKVTQPIALLNDSMEQVSNGNLQTRIHLVSASKEIQSLSLRFNQMVESLTVLIGHLDSSSKHVISASEQLRLTSHESKLASEQIATAMSEVAIGTEKQVEFAINASGIVSEITKGMDQVAISIEHVETSSGIANEKTIIGNQLVMKTVDQMKLVQQTVGETAEKVNVLGEKTKQVDKILGLIGEIAAQTNLLSLNAAIEAARAGEHGRGFAVVADEVRKLADQSGQAAKQIRSLIDEIRGGTDQVMDSMSRGAGVLKEGINVVQQTDEAFKEIALAVRQVSDETQGVSAIVSEVGRKNQNMVSSMEQISLIAKQFAGNTQHVAAAAEQQSASMDEISSASEALHHLSRDLDQVMGNFKV